MKFQRIALIGVVLLASAYVAESSSRGATTTPAGLPLYQFVETGTQPLPWNAQSLQSQLNATTMLGGPHGATNATEGVLAYRTSTSDVALFTQSAAGATSWTDYSTGNNVPVPAADPIPFFDPSNNVELLYVDEAGHVILLSPNDPFTPLWNHLHNNTPWRPYVTTDLTNLTGVVAANGLPSIQVSGASGTVAYRSAKNSIEVLTLNWSAGQPVPIYTQNALTVSYVGQTNTPTTSTTTTPGATTTTTRPVATTTTTRPAPTTTTTRPVATTTTTKPGTTTTTTKSGTSTTTTTRPVATTTTTKPVATTTTTVPVSVATAFASDPVVLPGLTPSFATTLNNGDLVVYNETGATTKTWTALNLTTLTASPTVSGNLALGTNTTSIDLAALSSAGSVELFSAQYATTALGGLPSTLIPSSQEIWNGQNVTSRTPGAPPLSGTLSVQVTPTQIAVAGQAANWGDLFVLTNATNTSTWAATDVSVTAGASARTVGNIVTGLQINGQLTLYAAGVNSPPPQGVGVYAIPSANWTRAISDGWPIISETGGLGTQSAPWVGFTTSGGVAFSPDFLLGQSIYNAHKRVTWLSFWTVSGPLANEAKTTTTYYNHGYAAGVWVATQIDSYRGLGVGLKPDWVIFDPEGYPDNHSSLDAPGGSSAGTIAKYATYWSSFLKGWQSGLNSVDPKLNAGVYASQSEYRNYSLSTLSMPVFEAIAFSAGGPVPVAGASGSNIRGFISFGAACSPSSTLASEAATLLNPPWAGQFNTLQFNAGVYCAPPST